MRVLITSEHADLLTRELVNERPERLALAYGRQLTDESIAVTHLVIDDDAPSSHVNVQASPQMQQRTADIETTTGSRLLGGIHSHPRTVPDPSRQDAVRVEDELVINPHLDLALVGVVIDRSDPRTSGPTLRLGRGQLSVHVMHRDSLGSLVPVDTEIVEDSHAFLTTVGARQPTGATAAVRGRRVLIAGCGSVGSVVAELLTRAGVPKLTLIDPDRVEAVNLTRSTYLSADNGQPKVEALAEHLRRINPELEITTVQTEISDDTLPGLEQAVGNADLVVAATDDARAQAMIDTLLFRQQRPGVFAAVYNAGRGGELIYVLPGITTCYRCTVAPRITAGMTPNTDYETGRIRGAVALGTDVHTVSTYAARLALAVIGACYAQDDWLTQSLLDGRTMIQIGLTPNFFDNYGLFDHTGAQHAWQTAWAKAEPSPDCPDCSHLRRNEQVVEPPQPLSWRQRVRAWLAQQCSTLRRLTGDRSS